MTKGTLRISHLFEQTDRKVRRFISTFRPLVGNLLDEDQEGLTEASADAAQLVEVAKEQLWLHVQ